MKEAFYSKLYYDRMRWKGTRFYWRLPQYKIVKWKRICEKFVSVKCIYCVMRLIYEHYKIKYNIDIPAKASIGAGLRIEHIGGIVVNPSTIIGKNVSLYNGVVLGAQNRGVKKGAPKIGDNVFLGPNSVIVGNVTIGNNVLIAGGAYVNFNVPDDSIVIGNPGKIIDSANATDGYLINKIDEI